jgi:hypothetical protein
VTADSNRRALHGGRGLRELRGEKAIYLCAGTIQVADVKPERTHSLSEGSCSVDTFIRVSGWIECVRHQMSTRFSRAQRPATKSSFRAFGEDERHDLPP